MLTHHHDEHDDDKPVGKILDRRAWLKLLGIGSAAIVAGVKLPSLVSAQEGGTPTSTPTEGMCLVKPEITEGPLFVANDFNRFDLRFDPKNDDIVKAGIPFLLRFKVSDITDGTCAPLEDAQIDVWHCDAEGVYSGVEFSGMDTVEEMWLRGYQLTDEDGYASFLTIVPGWYPGRAVHIHFKIRSEIDDGMNYEFTSQFFFDPEQIEELFEHDAYVERGLPNTPNERDGGFRASDDLLTLNLTELTDDDFESIKAMLADENEELEVDDIELDFETGYVALFDVGLDLSDAQVGANDAW